MSVYPVDTGRHGAVVLHERYDKSGNGSYHKIPISCHEDEVSRIYDTYVCWTIKAADTFFYHWNHDGHICNAGTFPGDIHIAVTYIPVLYGSVFHQLELVCGDAFGYE